MVQTIRGLHLCLSNQRITRDLFFPFENVRRFSNMVGELYRVIQDKEKNYG